MVTKLLTHQPVFKQLQSLATGLPHIKDLFRSDPDRAESMWVESDIFCLDISKQRVTREILDALEALFYQSEVPSAVDRLFSGEVVNFSEGRAALHTQLRVPSEKQGSEFLDVELQLQKMERLVDEIHQGIRRGFSGKAITDVVNLGVGGSDLGPLMVSVALREFASPSARKIQVHFASTIDGSQLFELLEHLNPETTLFLIASKSFTTIDTLSNADTARAWLKKVCPDEGLMLRCHFIGISAVAERMSSWGIPESNQLIFWDWVGGRFSLWSTVGCSIALSLGCSAFRALLAGAHDMDLHFRSRPPLENIPVLMALLGVWNVNFLGIKTHAILPYDGRLKFFPPFLQQLEMESNGKSVTQDGISVDYDTSPILWGDVGANAQHAFYQLLHQGTQSVGSDFILAANRYDDFQQHTHYNELAAQHELNIANCLAQSKVFAFGGDLDSSNPFRCYPGNQPSSTLLLNRLDPYSLGALIACYEHKVFTQAVLWGINPFDQWGVELGKEVALKLRSIDYSGVDDDIDSSTRALARKVAAFRETRPLSDRG